MDQAKFPLGAQGAAAIYTSGESGAWAALRKNIDPRAFVVQLALPDAFLMVRLFENQSISQVIFKILNLHDREGKRGHSFARCGTLGAQPSACPRPYPG
jgi:hypothetical protein